LIRLGGAHRRGPRLALLALLAATLVGCAEMPVDLTGDSGLSAQSAWRISKMPLFETPTTAPGDRLVVLYTGDNGWATFDKRLSADLAQAGAPVVAVSSLRYYLQPRSSTTTAGSGDAAASSWSAIPTAATPCR